MIYDAFDCRMVVLRLLESLLSLSILKIPLRLLCLTKLYFLVMTGSDRLSIFSSTEVVIDILTWRTFYSKYDELFASVSLLFLFLFTFNLKVFR